MGLNETTDSNSGPLEGDRSGLSAEALKRAITDHILYTEGVLTQTASPGNWYRALAHTVRDNLQHRWTNNASQYLEQRKRIVVYLSAEYLMGPQLLNNLVNLDIYDEVHRALDELGLDLNELIDQELEPGLGNGGLGRLAACFLDSLATLEIPAIGYGIRYEFGIFEQQIRDGWQVEKADNWLHRGNPWEIHTPEVAYEVGFEGHVVDDCDSDGRIRRNWVPGYKVKGSAHDTPIVGYKVDTANSLRLWKAEACESFDFQHFNQGDYYGAVEEKVLSENLTKVLYPNDEPLQGKALRLKQQYFLVSCALQELFSLLPVTGRSIEQFHEAFAIQLNDTHPALAIAELMRLLVDENDVDWEKAWEITQKTFAYTNHTLLPEALEKWPIPLFAQRLPRHLEIIYDINARFLEEVRCRYPGDMERVARLSLIDDGGERYIRMAHLACLGSHKINGVSELHSELLKESVLRDFYELMPEKFTNVTNGVTPRRFMKLCNPKMSDLITASIGDHWVKDLEMLRGLEPFAEDPDFRQQWREVKKANKQVLARYLGQHTGITVDPASMFDVQVKRLHEYKRQLLNVLHIVTLFNRIQRNPDIELTPRTFIFGGKAAPGYRIAKLVIKLISSVADVVNNDSRVADRLKVVFFPNFNVKNSHYIYPAADLSEQISTAGKEASGTGNMKFALNGALTIGTLDGANIEIRDAVGAEHFFLFGLTTDEIDALRKKGYVPWEVYRSNQELQEVIDLIDSGIFSPDDPNLFRPLTASLVNHDEYLLLADYRSYIDCQARVSEVYRNQECWTRMSILTVARMGKFSSDRAIRDYGRDIWHIEPRCNELVA